MRDPEATPLSSHLSSFLGDAALVAQTVPVVDVRDDRIRHYTVIVRGERNGPFANSRDLRRSLAAVGATPAGDIWRWKEAERLSVRDGLAARGIPIAVPLHPDSLGQVRDVVDLTATDPLVPILDIPCTDVIYRAPEISRAVNEARQAGMPVLVSGIADERCLPLVSVLGADALSVDPAMMRTFSLTAAARRAAALSAVAGRQGSVLLADGIDSERDRQQAAAFGVDGASGAAMKAIEVSPNAADRSWCDRFRYAPSEDSTQVSLFEVLAAGARPQVIPKRHLAPLSHDVEQIVVGEGCDNVLAGAFQSVDHFSSETEGRWSALAEKCAVIVAAGTDMPIEPARGVEGLPLPAGDPISQEWHVAALTAHRAVVICARDLGDTGEESNRRFEVVQSFDRRVVAQACRAIVSRLPGRTDM